jgi:hypothetical protein
MGARTRCPRWRRQSVPAPNREVDVHYSCRSSPQRYDEAELAPDAGREQHLNQTEPARAHSLRLSPPLGTGLSCRVRIVVPGLHTEVVRASRGEHAFLCGAGVAAALACLR